MTAGSPRRASQPDHESVTVDNRESAGMVPIAVVVESTDDWSLLTWSGLSPPSVLASGRGPAGRP